MTLLVAQGLIHFSLIKKTLFRLERTAKTTRMDFPFVPINAEDSGAVR